jgi:hypothetical protein
MLFGKFFSEPRYVHGFLGTVFHYQALEQMSIINESCLAPVTFCQKVLIINLKNWQKIVYVEYQTDQPGAILCLK